MDFWLCRVGWAIAQRGDSHSIGHIHICGYNQQLSWLVPFDYAQGPRWRSRTLSVVEVSNYVPTGLRHSRANMAESHWEQRGVIING
jgi:hypothetical protein